jgi:hypothetical protein
MNIITNADVKKFIDLFKVGVQDGERKDMSIYSSDVGDGKYYVALDFKFQVNAPIIETALIDNEPLDLNKMI